MIMKNVRVLRKADRKDNVSAVYNVLCRAMATMSKPKMMHLICEVNFDNLTSKIIQKIKEVFSSEFKKYERQRHERNTTGKLRKRNQPNMEIIYSIESKMLGTHQHDHIHFMCIVDFGQNYFGYKEISTMLNNTFNRLPFVVPIEKFDDFNYQGFHGTNACGFLRYRNPETQTKANDADFSEIRGHDLKTEFDDAMIRASYLCKSEQKDLLPDHIKRYSFGHTRAPRVSNDEIYQQVV